MDVSIIIPAYNNEKYVEVMLKALAVQKCSCEWEILLIDDSESDSMIQFETMSITNLKIIEKNHSGRAETRNVGIQNSKGKYLIFIDSDMIVDEHFVENHYKEHQKNKNDIILGKVNHIPAQYLDDVRQFVDKKENDNLHHFVVNDNYLNLPNAVFVNDEVGKYIGWICCLFSNCSIKRYVFEKCGLFDLSFVGWGLEDIELGYRFYKAGFTFKYCENIENFHVDHVADKNALLVEMGRNLKRLYNKHPDKEIKSYMSFLAGFKDLSMLYQDISRKENRYIEGRDFYFKPLSYASKKT